MLLEKMFSGFLRTQQDSVTLLKQSSKALYFTTLLNAHKYLFLCVTLGAMPLRSHCLLCLLRIQWFQTSLMLDWNGVFFVLSCSGLSWRLMKFKSISGVSVASYHCLWKSPELLGGEKGCKEQESSDIWAVKI